MLTLLLLAMTLQLAPEIAANSDPVTRTMTFAGHLRTWSEFIPPKCASEDSACMTVVLLHGGRPRIGGAPALTPTPGTFARQSGMLKAAREESFVLISPEAVDGNWNDGRPGVATGIDDVGFIRAMLADVGKRANVAPARTFATGVSNGGLMSYRLACEASDAFRAIAPVVANLGRVLAGSCQPAQAVDVLHIMGGADPLMPLKGGGIAGSLGADRGGVLSAVETFDFWASKLHATQTDAQTDGDVSVRTTTSPAGRIVQYILLAYGHGWPMPYETSEPRLKGVRGANPSKFDSTAHIVAFFKEAAPR